MTEYIKVTVQKTETSTVIVEVDENWSNPYRDVREAAIRAVVEGHLHVQPVDYRYDCTKVEEV